VDNMKNEIVYGFDSSTGCSRNRELREQADKPAMAGVLGQKYV